MELLHLPDETLCNIIHRLVYIDVIAFSQVNWRICSLCKDDNLWKQQVNMCYPSYPKYKSSWYQTFKYLTTVSITFKDRRIYINSIISIHITAMNTVLREDWDNVIIRSTGTKIDVYSLDLNSVTFKYTYSRDSGYSYQNTPFLLQQFYLTQLQCNGVYILHDLNLSDKLVRYKDYCIFLSKDEMQLLKYIPPYMIPYVPTKF